MINKNQKLIFSFMISAVVLLSSCTKGFELVTVVELSTERGGGGIPPVTPPAEKIVAGKGESFTGNGSLTVPTVDGIVRRIENGLERGALSTVGNFALSLAQVKSNLPKSSDPSAATGFDQVQLLVYAACSDLTTGTTPLMTSRYSVNQGASVTANKTALVAAGMRILDALLANVPSRGPASTQVNTSLGQLVDTLAATPANTPKIAFMSVCIAATTSGVSMMGF